jgi:hypothetical protein
MAFALPALRSPLPAPRPRHLRRERIELADGARTTLHLATYDPARTSIRVARLRRPQPLEAWCRGNGYAEAIVGGFYVRPRVEPLGELRTGGMLRAFTPFDDPWSATRACLHVDGRGLTIARRDQFEADPPGDLLQAGPLLVRDGAPDVAGDPEGFSAGARQFDSDITDGRHPRAAIGITRRGTVVALACDGRADDDAGLTVGELAETMAALGAVQAMNLDGGGSTSLVCAGRLRNSPREALGIPIPGGRAVATALVFHPR